MDNLTLKKTKKNRILRNIQFEIFIPEDLGRYLLNYRNIMRNDVIATRNLIVRHPDQLTSIYLTKVDEIKSLLKLDRYLELDVTYLELMYPTLKLIDYCNWLGKKAYTAGDINTYQWARSEVKSYASPNSKFSVWFFRQSIEIPTKSLWDLVLPNGFQLSPRERGSLYEALREFDAQKIVALEFEISPIKIVGQTQGIMVHAFYENEVGEVHTTLRQLYEYINTGKYTGVSIQL